MKTLFTLLIIAACSSAGIAKGACDKNKSSNTPTSRFTLIEGQAFDQKTNLTWSRCSVGSTWKKDGKCVGAAKLMRLDEATQYAKKLGGAWRVPGIEELHSIVARTCSNPAINSTVFPNVIDLGEGAPYWSTTQIKEFPTLIYYVDFLTGEADGHTKGFPLAVRLVRSGK